MELVRDVQADCAFGPEILIEDFFMRFAVFARSYYPDVLEPYNYREMSPELIAQKDLYRLFIEFFDNYPDGCLLNSAVLSSAMEFLGNYGRAERVFQADLVRFVGSFLGSESAYIRHVDDLDPVPDLYAVLPEVGPYILPITPSDEVVVDYGNTAESFMRGLEILAGKLPPGIRFRVEGVIQKIDLRARVFYHRDSGRWGFDGMPLKTVVLAALMEMMQIPSSNPARFEIGYFIEGFCAHNGIILARGIPYREGS